MSIISTSANYGGRVDTQQGNIKQFITSSQLAQWVYQRLNNGLVVQTPAATNFPVLIKNDLIVTGSIYNTSDERLKKNIENLNKNSIDDLFTINPITFTYKNDFTNKKHYGILAQDLEKVFPELVENNNTSGYKTVNYQELIPIMLSKIKKMQEEIDELKQNNK
jgi:hypothetical protein